jgi:hypothetical protein
MPADGQPGTGTGVVDTLLDSIGRLALLLPNGEKVARISPTLVTVTSFDCLDNAETGADP